MRKIVLSIALFLPVVFLKAQSIGLNQAGAEVFCSNGIDSFKATWSNVPPGSNIVFYQSTNPNFNPYLGQGDSIGFIHVDTTSTSSNPIITACPRILGIFIDACNNNGRSEPANEYIVITSGNAGFLPSTLQVNLPANKDINMGSGTCSFQTPSGALMTLLRTGACNAGNLFPAGPSDFIPANAIVVIFTGNGTDYPYNFSGLCGTGQPVYILQNACTLAINSGSFVNNGDTICANLSGNRYRSTIISTGACTDNLSYDRCGLLPYNAGNPNAGDGNYVIHLPNTDTSSVGNGGIQNNIADKCNGVVLDTSVKTQTIKYPIPNDGSANPATNFCNTGYHYIKAITNPAGSQPFSNLIKFRLVCIDLNAVPQVQTICSGDHAIINNSSTDPNAVYSWTYSAGANVQGAAVGNGNKIDQILTNSGTTKDSVTYVITATDTICNITKVVRIYVNPIPVPFKFGNDTSFCGAINLTLSTGDPTTVWQKDGAPIATAPSINVTQFGIYIATISSGCGNVADTIKYTQSNTQSPIKLGNDTSYCGTFSRTLSTGDANTFWNTGVTAAQITVTTPGTYIAKINSSCGSVADTIIISQTAGLNFTFGTDNTTICKNDSITLDATVSGNNNQYVWSTGEVTPKITIKQQGVYWVHVTKNGCTGGDTITVSEINKLPSFYLGRDTTFCDTFSLLLNSNLPQTTWFRNNVQFANTSSVIVKQGGTYIASASNSCGVVADTIVIFTGNALHVDLGVDTAICGGQNITLDATVPGIVQYLWKYGETTPTITVNQVDKYWVEVTNGICTAYDTIFVDTVGQPDPIFLGNDTSFCGNFSKLLFTGDAKTIWSTGETGLQITVNKPGTYIAENKNACGSEKGTIVIGQFALPQVNIGKDTTICDSILLDVGNGNYRSIIWSTGDTVRTTLIFSSGTYYVLVSDSACLAADSITIKKECFYDVYIPTAFSPNHDGQNDVLVPLSFIKGIQVIDFFVFDRWSEKVFESHNFTPGDITKGWDGTYKNKDSQVDIYVYYYTVKLPDDQIKSYKGTVSLVR